MPETNWFKLMAFIDLHAFVEDLAEPLDFIDGRLIPLLHLFDDLEGPMLLAEYTIDFVGVSADIPCRFAIK